MFSKNYRIIILLSILIVTMLVMMKMTSLDRMQLTSMEMTMKDSVAPLQEMAFYTGSGFKTFFSYFTIQGNLQKENKQLQEKNRQLESKLNQVDEYRLENERLKKLLAYRDNNVNNYKMISAAIIGHDPGNWFGTVTLNRGTIDGVKRDMAVVVSEGLVGRVIAVSRKTSEVLLVTDPRSGVGALIEDNRIQGVVEGIANSSNVVTMSHLYKDAQIKPHQVVISSGIGGVYPKGIRVGEIISSENDSGGLFKNANLKPFVDFRVIEEVMIIKEVYKPELNLPLEGN